MSPFHLYSLASVVIFCLGLHGVIIHAYLLRKLLALNMMASAVFLFLVSVAYRNAVGGTPDPVPHAMVLTGIVVAVSASGFALALARRAYAETGSAHFLDEDSPE